MKNILSIKNVSYSYHTQEGETPALTDISLHPDSGEIYINGCSSSGSLLHIGYMLQKDSLFEWRSVYKNVLLGLETRNMLTSEKKKLADKMLETYGLVNFKNVKPSQLSGGMRQIGRAHV